MERRMFNSAMRWCMWCWSETVAKDLERLYLVKTPWGAIGIHWIKDVSFEVDMHDHPMAFFSVVLRGWYIEKRQRGQLGDVHFRWIRRWNYFRASKWDRHRISNISSKGATTLVFEGPKRREWGFHVPEGFSRNGKWKPAGWIPWREYLRRTT